MHRKWYMTPKTHLPWPNAESLLNQHDLRSAIGIIAINETFLFFGILLKAIFHPHRLLRNRKARQSRRVMSHNLSCMAPKKDDTYILINKSKTKARVTTYLGHVFIVTTSDMKFEAVGFWQFGKIGRMELTMLSSRRIRKSLASCCFSNPELVSHVLSLRAYSGFNLKS